MWKAHLYKKFAHRIETYLWDHLTNVSTIHLAKTNKNRRCSVSMFCCWKKATILMLHSVVLDTINCISYDKREDPICRFIKFHNFLRNAGNVPRLVYVYLHIFVCPCDHFFESQISNSSSASSILAFSCNIIHLVFTFNLVL